MPHTLKGTVYYVLIISQPNCYFSQKTKSRDSGGFGHYKILPLNSFFFLLLLWPLFHWKQQVVTPILSMCLHLPAVFLLWKKKSPYQLYFSTRVYNAQEWTWLLPFQLFRAVAGTVATSWWMMGCKAWTVCCPAGQFSLLVSRLKHPVHWKLLYNWLCAFFSSSLGNFHCCFIKIHHI